MCTKCVPNCKKVIIKHTENAFFGSYMTHSFSITYKNETCVLLDIVKINYDKTIIGNNKVCISTTNFSENT